jgi:microcystin-dependent protein
MANYIKSTNFTAKDNLPSGDAARIVKGAEIDVEFNAIASAVSSKADSNSPSFTGTPTAPTAVAGTSTTQVATTAFALDAAKAAFPVGGIIIWSGSIAAIPVTWQLCDGTNGTPNLRDRFVVGAGSTYAVGATGGANTVTLDATMIPAHTHTVSASGTTSAVSNDHSHNFSGTTSGQSNTHSHAVNDPGHTHANRMLMLAGGGAFGSVQPSGDPGIFDAFKTTGGRLEIQASSTGISLGNANADHSHTYSGTTSGQSTNHTHTVTVTGTTGNGTGGGLAHENRPPYFALCYIQKMV